MYAAEASGGYTRAVFANGCLFQEDTKLEKFFLKQSRYFSINDTVGACEGCLKTLDGKISFVLTASLLLFVTYIIAEAEEVAEE